MKKLIAILICTFLLLTSMTPIVFANGGNIDLYQAFSSDQSKTEVGSRIYKWSMYLPDDAVIYKTDQANYFNMSTTSYQSNVSLTVNKNNNNQSLEDILYSLQNQSKQGYYYLWGDKEFLVDIAKDENGQRYIKIIKADGYYDYYLVDASAEEFREYVENRIYIRNNNIYNLTISMNGEFYKEHDDMFAKLAASFKLSFDDKNPNIKELSDSVSNSREYKNTSYGWKMVLSPYWKVEGTPNARNQSLRPVYTDEEMNQTANADQNNIGMRVQDGITVSLVGSSQTGESVAQWAQKDIEKLKNNYNKDVFEIINTKEYTQLGSTVYNVAVRFETVTNKPYIMNNLYVIGNGYKYLVSAVMLENKYLNDDKKKSFNNMLNTFQLDKNCISKYLGKIVQAENLVDFNTAKTLKLKKNNFATSVTQNWTENNYNTAMYMGSYYDPYMYIDKYSYTGMGVSNNEALSAFETDSNISLSMNAGLNSGSIEEQISQMAENYSKIDEVRLKLAKVDISSTESNGAVIYCISKEYDTKAISKFVDEDTTKNYSFEALANEYQYFVKVGKDLYTLYITVPVANASQVNINKIKQIWNKTTINNVNYSSQNLTWKKHSLEDYDKGAKTTKVTNPKAGIETNASIETNAVPDKK